MSKIKLLKIDELKDGTIRLQSQLMIGKDTANFIIQAGVLKYWGNGSKGYNFYEYKEPYEIITRIQDMTIQEL